MSERMELHGQIVHVPEGYEDAEYVVFVTHSANEWCVALSVVGPEGDGEEMGCARGLNALMVDAAQWIRADNKRVS